ncbi:Mannitol 2-dehydrogenase [Serratia entomophila]|uniref:mannitol dehydrogenase family protein n=1 Tax=Serratia entomophila TaxID=42906 RepID=UPI00217A7884|nr:mannitol dehydrogenase family protein [Serratia entomophila]CAI1089425.1 Mannitol 2-dehydrogenase [Serratia entomophila]CAI1797819.1 Mannitol 2-dehydrogenase [Serratia entomophila]CAI1835497.1 Mannitol 2-dehydrogenase [Serratia entomophila]CAI1944886.1 Mannitol 2-dehydrogenase [Serratia entomophila]CAI2091632.1 Mannitol 2-dehydrogenase [Serratia entomophila]
MKLSSSSALPAAIARPGYPRERLKPRIVHIGFGAFHRAHQAVYADRLAAEHASDWGYCEISMQHGRQKIADLQRQELLYSVAEMDDGGWRGRVIGVVHRALHLQADGLTAVLEAMADPQVAIVSLTISEKGYCHQPASGQLMANHPAIEHDIAHPLQPQSAPGLILAALRLRRRRGLPPFAVMSCDNMPANGQVTRNVITQLAQCRDAELADWLRREVAFPSTMVDRIVPAVTQETRQRLQSLLGGVEDDAGVACEPFSQWVIEDNFPQGRPAWEKAGAELVRDVLPYEEMKLRMLNGSHSFLAYLGYLAGYQHIGDCMQDADFARAARHLMLAEQAPTLQTREADLTQYADSLLQRFSNRALKHRTGQIATDGSQKLPQRLLDSIRWHLAHGSRFDCLALGVAGWLRYVGGQDEQGQPIELEDPLREPIAALVAGSEQGQPRVLALLQLEAVFGRDLPGNPTFVSAIGHAYRQLLAQGAKAAVAALPSFDTEGGY